MEKQPLQLIECHVSGATYYINIASIIYLESQGHYLRIITENASYVIRHTLKNFIKNLDAKSFYQIHQSFVIHLKFIESVSHQEVLLKGDYHVPIGRKYKESFLTEIHKYLKQAPL